MRIFYTILFLLAIDIYAFQALRTLFQDNQSNSKWIAYGLFWMTTLLTIIYLVVYASVDPTTWSKSFRSISRTLVFILYLSKFMVLIPLVIDDLRRLISMGYHQFSSSSEPYSLSRSKFLSRMGLVLGSFPLISLTYGMIRNPYRYQLFKSKVAIKGLPDNLKGLKIVQISDIHSGSFTFKDPVKNAIDIINAQQADLVFFTGDLVNSWAEEMEDFMDVFDKIKSKYGVYSVLGNHDYALYHSRREEHVERKEENMRKMKATHKQLGWNLLMNENAVLNINDTPVAVIGVENYSTKPQFPKFGDLNKAYQGTESAALKLLLSHDPSHWEDQVTKDFKDIHITFSGHTHGMQFGVEIPGWIKWSPIKYMYKQWAGLYHQEDQYLYVNRGLGFIGYPGRVGILPEVALIELDQMA